MYVFGGRRGVLYGVYVGDGYRDKDGNRCVDALYLDCLQFAEAK